MSLAFTLLTGTVVWLDPRGKTKATLLGSRSVTIDDPIDNVQQLAESLYGNYVANFTVNKSSLTYLQGDNRILFGPLPYLLMG